MASPPRLAELQLRLRRLIASPAPRAADTAASELPDPAAEAAALGIRGDARLDPAARVAIYSGMYFARIRDAIAEDYPALLAALGDGGFEELVRRYLAAHPTRDPSLRRAAADLADFAARDPGLATRPAIAELARFEAALVLAFDAPDEPALDAATLEALAAERWPDLSILPVRSLVLLAPRTAVDELRAALLRGEEPPDPDAGASPVALRVWRQDLRVYHRRMSRLEQGALARALGGVRFADLCGWAAEVEPTEDPAEAVVGLLHVWLQDGVLVDTLRAPPAIA